MGFNSGFKVLTNQNFIQEEIKIRRSQGMLAIIRVLRRIFGPKRDEVTGEWTKLHNEELNDLYCSPNTVRVIKSRMRWVGHVARMRRENVCTEF